MILTFAILLERSLSLVHLVASSPHQYHHLRRATKRDKFDKKLLHLNNSIHNHVISSHFIPSAHTDAAFSIHCAQPAHFTAEYILLSAFTQHIHASRSATRSPPIVQGCIHNLRKAEPQHHPSSQSSIQLHHLHLISLGVAHLEVLNRSLEAV